MTDVVLADRIARAGAWAGAADRVVLDHASRMVRRKRLVGEGGLAFLVDLGAVVSLEDGDAFVLRDGRHIWVVAADEPLLAVTGDLVRLAWHVGNRHTPCQIEAGRLVIRNDPVLRAMLRHLGANVAEIRAPFCPEGGAYGHGRTMGHDHGPHNNDHGEP